MSKLNRKLLRDFNASKWLFAAIVVVILLGVAFFEASFLGYRNLKTSYDYTYETLRFADFTVKVAAAPAHAADEVEAISGVEAVTARMNADFALVLPGDEETRVLARVISLPSASRAAVNDVKIEEGAYFEEGEADALLVEQGVAGHHGIRPDDTVYLASDGETSAFRVAGIAVSPEYIWLAKSLQEPLVSPETFAVVFVPHEAVPGLAGEPVTNEFCVVVNEEADRDAVMGEVEAALEPYGVLEVVPREEQPSNMLLSSDLEGFGEMAEVFPLLFLIVGALATYILLTRIVYRQRPQVGLMRAVGYSRRQVLLHYLGFAFIIGVVGSVIGTAAGYFLSEVITELYVSFLNLPYTRIEMGLLEWAALAEGVSIGIIPCLIAGFIPARAAARLNPAEAMRNAAPTAGRRTPLERLFPPLSRLATRWKIPLRNIFRSRRRSLYTVIGIAFGVSLILVSAGFIDTAEYFVKGQFEDIQRYDAEVTFAQPQPSSMVDEVEGWEGTRRVEPVLEVPVKLEYGEKSSSTLMVGLVEEAALYGVLSPDGTHISVPEQGMVLSEGLRNTLDVEAGDTVRVQSASGVRDLEVVRFAKQSMGAFAYASLAQAQSIAGVDGAISGVMLAVNPGYEGSAIREKAYGLPGVASVEITSETKGQIDELMGFMRGMMYVMLAFGAAMALAIVFTVVTINVLERSREIATMRTLGEGKGRIGLMITVENLLLGLTGLIPGILLGYAVAYFMFKLIETDLMTLTLVIYTRTYLLTAAIVILIMLVSQLPGIRQVNRLDLPKMIKEQVS